DLAEPEEVRADDRARKAAHPADDHHGEGAQLEREAHPRVERVVREGEEHAGEAAQAGRDEEGGRDRTLDVDPEDACGARVLRERPDLPPEGRPAHEIREHEHERYRERDDREAYALERRNADVDEERRDRARWERDEVAAVAQLKHPAEGGGAPST